MSDHTVTESSTTRSILEHLDFRVAAVDAPADPIEALRGRMARFSDGADHAGPRHAVERKLADVDTERLRARVFHLATTRLEPGCDLVPLARTIPPEAIAGECGMEDPPGVAASALRLVDRLAARIDDPVRPSSQSVTAGLDRWFPDLTDDDVAFISILFQTTDATAALIVAAAEALLPWRADRDPTDDDVEEVARSRATVVATTRRAHTEIVVADGVVFGQGETVEVRLTPELAFGAGRHRCPGRAHALAAATGFVAALACGGLRVSPPTHLQPRPNVRLPESVICHPVGGTEDGASREDQSP